MCDIAAFIGKPSQEDLKKLFLKTGSRNRDATGVAFRHPDSLRVLKSPGPAFRFVKDEKWSQFYEASADQLNVGLVHSRIATHGDPDDNANNHPHYTDDGSVLVHKGVVNPTFEYEAAKSICDSEQILLSLEDQGLEEGVVNCPGWMHLFYIKANDPTTLWTYSNSDPIQVWDNDGIKYFSTAHSGTLGQGAVATGERLPLDQWVGFDTETGEEKIWGPKVSSSASQQSYVSSSMQALAAKSGSVNSTETQKTLQK